VKVNKDILNKSGKDSVHDIQYLRKDSNPAHVAANQNNTTNN